MVNTRGLIVTGALALFMIGIVASRQQAADAAPTATLSVTPQTGTYTVGMAFDVDVKLTTGGQAVAGVDVRITLSDNLQYVSSSADGSVFDQDVVNPRVNGNQITFSRVRFDQGYSGTNGHVMRLRLQAIGSGQATVTIDQPATDVLDYASAGDILQSTVSAGYTTQSASGPEVDVAEGTTHIADGGTVTYNTPRGTPLIKTFTVRNLGSAPLTVGTLNAAAEGFTVAAALTGGTLAPDERQTFSIRASADLAGTYTYGIQFPTSDTDENPFNFTLRVVVSAGALCGDGVCSRRESCTACPADCGQCVASSSSSAPVYAQSSSAIVNPPIPIGDAQIAESLCQEARALLTYKSTPAPLTLPIEGQIITFRDVAGDAWFAKYVRFALRGQIAGGYRDAQGRLTGLFGPANAVTHGEATKMLLLSIGQGESAGPSRNALARGQWFERYVTRAEEANWRLHQSGTLDGNRPATRGEIARAIVDAFQLQTRPKVISFGDLPDSHPYAADIHTLTGYGIMAGDPTGTVRPDAPVNRAEFSKLVSVATNVSCR